MAITVMDRLTVVQEYLERSLLRTATPKLVYYQFGEKHPLPGGQGTTIAFSSYRPLKPRLTPLVEGSETGGIAAGKALDMNKRNATVQEYGDYVNISELAGIVSIDPGVKGAMTQLSNQFANSIDAVVMDKVRLGFRRMCAMGTSATDITGTIDSATSPTSFVLHFAALDENWRAANGFANGTLTILDQMDTCYAWTVRIKTSAAAAGDATDGWNVAVQTYDTTDTYQLYDAVEAYRPLPRTPFAGSVIAVSKPDASIKTKGLSSRTLDLAKLRLSEALATPLSDGHYVCLIDDQMEFDFMYDQKWVAAATYSNVKLLYQGELGTWNNIRFVKSDRLAKEDLDGTYNERGEYRIATLLGANAYGITELAGDAKRITVMSARDLGQKIPMTSSISWKTGFTASPLNSVWGINIICGANTAATIAETGTRHAYALGMEFAEALKDFMTINKAKPVSKAN